MSDSEFQLIKRHFADSGLGFAMPGVELGIGDDAALIKTPENELLALSVDTLVAGVHFPHDAEPSLIAYRALAVNLSDLAAMGAKPLCFTLALVLPESDEAWLAGFSKGLLELAQEFACPLVGGDTTKGPLSITIGVHGTVDPELVLRRDAAQVGDKIFVSGTLGDGAIALASMGIESHLGADFVIDRQRQSPQCPEYFRQAYFKPTPRVQMAQRAASLINSAIDVSDGLAGDLGHILKASNVGARLDLDRLPYSAQAQCCMSAEQCRQAALFGGDDYELCFTAPAVAVAALERIAQELSTSISCIGEIVSGAGLAYVDSSGAEISIEPELSSYDHFGDLA